MAVVLNNKIIQKHKAGNTLVFDNFIVNYNNCSLNAKGPADCQSGPIYIAEYLKADGTFWQIRYTKIPNSKEKIKNPYNIGKSGHLKDGENVVRFYDYFDCIKWTDISTCARCYLYNPEIFQKCTNEQCKQHC